MSYIQRLFQSVLPHSWSASMESESRSWIASCTCGHGQSIWDLGGIRWMARGNPLRRIYCPKCHATTWHLVAIENTPEIKRHPA
jgi:hypothetical protein